MCSRDWALGESLGRAAKRGQGCKAEQVCADADASWAGVVVVVVKVVM
jgi:hypothetical protein